MGTEQQSPTYSAAIHARRRQISRAWISKMRSGALVELRSGGPRNLFLVHDGEGDTMLYLNFARRMPEDLAVFAIEPRRMERVPLAHVRIEDMAAFYIDEVRKKQPRGPYLLGGLCAGGVIAYEMASQLVRCGESVELVALLETATPKASMRRGRIRNERLGRLKQAIAEVRKSGLGPLQRARMVSSAVSQKLLNALLWEIFQRGKQWTVSARFRLLRHLLPRERAWPRFVPELSVLEIFDSTHARYEPKPLAVPAVVLVRAQTGEEEDTPYRRIYDDETFGWNAITHGLTVIDVDGGHSTMLHEPHVDSLAAALMPYLQRNTTAIR